MKFSLLSLSLLLVIVGCSDGNGGDHATQENKRGGDVAAAAKAPPPPSYAETPEYVAEGKQIFETHECPQCHPGGMKLVGPSLRDSAWVYGSEPSTIFGVITNGTRLMPSFSQKLEEYQRWKLVAFVRSMAGLAPAPAVTDSVTDSSGGS